MKIKIKLLNERAVLPSKRDDDAGWDLYSTVYDTLYPGERARIGIGIALEIPDDHFAMVLPRSGNAAKGFIVTTGTIDAGYRGELSAQCVNSSRDLSWRIKRGDRVAQLVILPVPKVEWDIVQELTPTVRGAKGFGSSGA